MKYFLLFIVCVSFAFSSDWVLKNNSAGHIIKLQSTDENTAYAVFSNVGATDLFKTTDQGKSWELIYRKEAFDLSKEPQIVNPEDAYFLSDGTCYITYRYGGHIRKSSDGGKSFKRMKLVSRDIDITTNIAMLNDKIGFIDSIDSLLVTFDGWNTFEMRDRDRLKFDTIYTYNINSPHFIDSANIHFISHLRLYNYNIYTDKFTEIHNFSQEKDIVYKNVLMDFTYSSKNQGFAVGHRMNGRGDGSDEIIFKTTNGGKDWKKIRDKIGDPMRGYTGIEFYDERNGIAVGAQGKVLMTNDGGDTWKYEVPEIFYDPVVETIYGPWTMQVTWIGKTPCIATFNGNIYKYEGDFFKFLDPAEAPGLIEPKDSSITQNSEIDFSWELKDTNNIPVFNLSQYQYFDKIEKEFTLDPGTQEISINNLENNTLYYWRVGIKDGNDINWSKTFTFSINLAKPYLVSPDCGRTGVQQNVELSWKPVSGAEHYKLEVCKDRFFVDLYEVRDSLLESKYFIENLKLNTEYYWRVKAFSSEYEGAWSGECNFVVGHFEATTLLQPEDNAVDTDTSVTFTWRGTEETKSFLFQLSTSEYFKNINEFKNLEKDDEEVTINGLHPGTRYYWRVFAQHKEGSTISETFTFTTKLNLPVLASPENGKSGLGDKVTLKWNAIENVTGYHLQLSNDDSFNNIVADTSGITSNEIALTELDSGKTYYWHLKAYNDMTESDWSDTWQFTLSPASSVKDSWANAISIIPNPVRNKLTCRVNNTQGPSSIDIISITGKILISENMHLSGNDEFDVDISSLPYGTYFLRVRGDQETESVKFVRE